MFSKVKDEIGKCGASMACFRHGWRCKEKGKQISLVLQFVKPGLISDYVATGKVDVTWKTI